MNPVYVAIENGYNTHTHAEQDELALFVSDLFPLLVGTVFANGFPPFH